MAFNDCITRQDLTRLADLLTDDHVLALDDDRIVGKVAVTEAWRQVIAAFPDYRNSFEAVLETVDGVVIRGRSICSEPELDGPALWRATMRDGKLSRWQVLADTPETRAELGIGARQTRD